MSEDARYADMKLRILEARSLAEDSVLKVSGALSDADIRKVFWIRLYSRLVAFFRIPGDDAEHPMLKVTWRVIIKSLIGDKKAFSCWSQFIAALKKSNESWAKKDGELKEEYYDETEMTIYLKLVMIASFSNPDAIIPNSLEILGGREGFMFWCRYFDIGSTRISLRDFSRAYEIHLISNGISPIPDINVMENILKNTMSSFLTGIFFSIDSLYRH